MYKFGGASVRDAAGVRNVARILREMAPRPLVVVISAMGKMTNALESIIQAHYHQQDELNARLKSFTTYHETIARELMGDQAEELLTDLNDLWVELQWILEEPPHSHFQYEYDQVIVFGELASTRIVSTYLDQQGITHELLDARSIIRTGLEYTEARVDWDATQEAMDQLVRPALAEKGMILTQGFIGSTPYNESTSLGREGSDYTAAILASTLDAKSVTFWKDVPGIMTGDPKRFEKVGRLEEISYREAIEMTYYGAKVIHPKTIKPLQNKNIPLFVKSFDHPSLPGTVITGAKSPFLPPIVVAEADQALIQISTKDFSFVAEEHLSEIFTHVASLRIKVNSMRNTAVSFLLCVRNEPEKINNLVNFLSTNYTVNIQSDLELITIRHANESMLKEMQAGREILFEEKFGDTDQFIVKG